MSFEVTFKMTAKEDMLNHIYKYSYATIYGDYKKIIKEHLSVSGLNPEDIAIYYVNLDTDLVWLGGKFQGSLYYGMAPVYIHETLRDKVNVLNQKRKELKVERDRISAYLAKVLTEASTLKDVYTYLPPNLHNVAEFKSVYKEGELSHNPSLSAIADKYMMMINERLILNLLVKD
jgi:predicted nuclease with TOPRIM domain